jgi:hypothetical protein
LPTINDNLIEGKIDDMGRRERRSKQPLDDIQEAIRYWKLKEALYLSLWRTHIAHIDKPYGSFGLQIM